MYLMSLIVYPQYVYRSMLPFSVQSRYRLRLRFIGPSLSWLYICIYVEIYMHLHVCIYSINLRNYDFIRIIKGFRRELLYPISCMYINTFICLCIYIYKHADIIIFLYVYIYRLIRGVPSELLYPISDRLGAGVLAIVR